MKKQSSLGSKIIKRIGRSLTFVLALALFVCFFAVNAFAAEPPKETLSVSQSELNPKDEFVLYVALDGANNDLLAYTARLSYDKNVFETVSVNSFEERDNWSNITYNAENQKFVLINKSGSIDSTELLQITMRVKENAAPGKTKITLQGITASNGKDVVEIADATVEVLVIRDGLPEDGSVPVDHSFIDDFKDSVITVKQSKPWLIAVVAVLLVLAVAFLVFFLIQSKRRGYTAKKRNTVAIITGILIIILLALLLFILLIKPGGDVNVDGKVDYNDTQEIVDYLLDIKSAEDNKADVNNDGKVDIGDVADSVNKVKPSVNVTDGTSKPSQNQGEEATNVSLNQSTVPYFASKGETVTLKLNISVRPKMDAKYVEIKGELYKLRKTGENTYEVDVTAPDKAGIFEVSITGVVLENGKKVKTDFTVAVDVLRDKPAVTGFKIDSSKEIPEISFKINDPDNAFRSGYIIVTDENGAAILRENLSANKNLAFKARMADNKKYHIAFVATYDPDHDYFTTDDKLVADEKIFERNITFTRNYGFIASDFALTEKVSADDDLVLTFKNGYDSYYKVSTVVIDGKEYPVTGPDANGVYSVVIPKAATKGEHTVNIESVTLENDSTTYYPVDKDLNYIYLKDAPGIDEIRADVTDNVLHVEVDITDSDNTVTNVTVYLKNADGEIVETIILGKDTSVDIPLADFEEYTVEIKVDYDLGDGIISSVTEEYDETVKRVIEIDSISATAPDYVNRGETIEIVFTIEDNVAEEPTHILINGAKLPLEKQADGTYKVSFNAPAERPENGIAEYEVIRLYYGEAEADVDYTFTVEVLKLAPTVENEFVYDSESPVLQFDLVDDEDTFVSGKVIITNKADGKKYEFDFTNADTSIEIALDDLTGNAEYALQIEITYDLDSDKTDGVNLYTEIVKEDTIEIIDDYEFVISDFRLMDITNDVVTLEFTSTNASKYLIRTVTINGKVYPAEYNGDVYVVSVPAEDFGKERTELVLERAVLENLRAFTEELSDLDAVLVFKTYPTAVITGATVLNDKTAVNVHYDMTDTDSTVIISYILLKQGDEIIAKAQSDDTGYAELRPENGGLISAGEYTVEIIASFDAVDGLTHNDETVTNQPRILTVSKHVSVTDIKTDALYAEKGADVELTITVDTNTPENITDVEINGNKYSAEKLSDNTYKVIVKASENAGIEEYTVDKAYFGEEEATVSCPASAKVDVLKDIPVISNGVVDTDAETPILSFDLNDPDNAFISGQVTVESTGKDTLYFDFDKPEDSSTVEIALTGVVQYVVYTVKANVTYDRDSSDDAQNRDTATLAKSQFELIRDYDFSISGFELKSMDEEYITLKFTSHNDSTYGVNKAVINGNEYFIESRNGDEYTVKVPVSDIDDVRTVLTLEKVTLENLKAFEEELKELDTVLVFKTRPEANITSSTVSEAQDQIVIEYTVTDPDNTVTNAYAVIKDGEKIYAKVAIDKNEATATFTSADGEAFKAGRYTIEIIADYDRTDGASHRDEKITANAFPMYVMRQVEVISVSADKYFYVKGEEVTLTLEIKSNAQEPIQSIKLGIDETLYTPELQQNGTYKITFPAPNEAGNIRYEVVRIDFPDEMHDITDSAFDTVEVLKSQPTIDPHTVKIDDSGNTPILAFEITDTDGAFESGKVIIRLGNDKVAEYPFTALDPRISLTGLDEFVEYVLDIEATYDLDFEENAPENIHTEYLEEDNVFKIMTHYNFDLKEYSIIGINKETVTLGFTSTNASGYNVQSVVINGKSYPATNTEGNGYTVEVPVEDTNRVKTDLELTEATLVNLKSFDVENCHAYVFLDAPTVSDVSIKVDESTINVEVEPIDQDNTITTLYVSLISVRNETVIEKAAMQAGDQYTVSIPVDNADVYNVVISADYDRVDGETHIKEELFKVFDVAGIPITATVVELDAIPYAEKNGSVELTFTVDANTDLDVAGVKINGAEAQLTKQGDQYVAIVTAPSDYGYFNYKVTELTFANDEVVTIDGSPEATTYVLKQAPVVGEYKFDDTIDTPEITIRIDDPDETLLEETITVIISDSTGKEIRRETIQVNEESVIQSDGLLHEQKEKFILTIDGLYDLDDVKNDTANDETHTYNLKDVLGEREIELLDYEVHFEEITVNSVDASESTVTITFTAFNNTEQNLSEVLVGGSFYPVEGPDANGNYTVTVPYTPNGDERVTVTLEGVKLVNGRIVAEEEDSKSFDIFLDRPTAEISDVTVADNMISVTAEFSVTDNDNTVTVFYAVLKNADGKEAARKEITVSDTSVTLNVGGSGKYTVEILADYERFDGAEHTDELLAKSNEVKIESIDILELKNIGNSSLYYGVDKVDILDITGGIPAGEALENYYVKIEMDHLPAFYAKVKEIRFVDGKLTVFPDEEVFMQYVETDDTVDKLAFEISYKDSDGEHVLVGSAQKFFDEISQNLRGTYELTQDLDASDIVAGNAPIINGTFTGTINGNGYKIINLHSTIFSTLNNAMIDNLIIENADVNVNQNKRGILATSATGSTMINNVHVINSKIVKTSGLIEIVGAIVGQASNTTRIRSCSAVNVYVSTDTQAAGIAGGLYDSAVVADCYVTGTIEATFNNPTWGARAGGIVAWDNSTGGYIDNCYANVKIVVPNPIYSGGLVGGSNNLSSIAVRNSFAINTGSGRKVIGFDLPDSCKIENIWETNVGNAISSVNGTDRIRVIDDFYDESFYLSKLKFDPYFTWNLELLKIGRLPNLIMDPMPNDCESYEILENANGIPNYNEVRNNESYKADRELAYYNVAQIAPFITVNEWVNIANGFTNENLINEKIATVLAFDENGELIVGLRAEDVERLVRVTLIYESGKSDDLSVSYLRIMGGLIAEYEIKELGLKYQFDSYVAKLDDSLIDKLVGWAESYDYKADIASTTPEEESRLYVDYYNESVQSKVETIIKNYLFTSTGYPTYLENAVVQEQLANSITQDTVKKLLYAYNYYDKWYNINLETVCLSDLLFFKGTFFGKEITTKYLIDTLYNATQANRDTNATYTYYNYALQSKTGKTFIEFLEYTFSVLDGYSDYNEWFIDHFDGIIVEQPSLSANANEIKYRIWDLLSSSAVGDRRRNILPLLTAPQDDMYLISIPSQIVIGSLLRYNEWIKGGADRVEVMTERIQNFGIQLGHLYGTMANLIPDSPSILNSHVHFQYDSRFDFPQSDKVAAGTQDKGTTQDPVVKWVFEAINQLAAANGSGAYANGTDVWWVAYCALGGGDFTYFVFAHETAHNQDGYYFYDGKGRRVGTGPESHSDDNYGMATGDESIMFNVFRDYDFTEDISNNFSYTRIDSQEEIKDFYYDIFETKYAIDYMMADAFLRLSAEEQAKVAVQVSHTPSGKSFSTTYSRMTADAIKAMELKSIKDLMNNKIALHTTGTVNSAGSGAYGQDSFFNVYWYQPFNNNGAPDAYVFRRNGREMLGLGGYMNGYVAYMSGDRTDLDALRIATGDPDITWEEYKMNRYGRVAAQLGDIPYFDYEELVDQFEAAFKVDAKTGNLNESTNLQKVIYGIVKRATNDFTDGDFFNAPEAITEIRTAKELIAAMKENPYGNYKLVDDIDFSGITPEGGTYYVQNPFVGILDGDGHTIKGLQYPICNSAAYAQFKDFTISASSFSFSANAYLAKTAKRSVVEDINVVDADLYLPFFASRNVCYEYGENSVEVAEYEIDTLQKFIDIGSSDDNLKKKYIITADIDFSSYTATKTSVITGTFSGSINGNGHVLSGLKNASLFANFRGTAENLIIRNFTNERNGSLTAAFAAESSNATFRNMYFDGIKITGWQNTAPLSGYDKASVIEQITVVNTEVISSGYYASLLVARKSGGRISNCYVEGKLNMNSTQLGSVVGELMDGGLAENTVANVEITRRSNGDSRNMSGGFVGSLYNNAAVINSIALGNMVATPDGSSVAWKFTASDANMINSKVSNSYELKEATGNSSIRDGVTTLKEVTTDTIHTVAFWRDTLKLSEEIWNFDTVKESGHPQLKHNGLTNISAKTGLTAPVSAETRLNVIGLPEINADIYVLGTNESALYEELQTLSRMFSFV